MGKIARGVNKIHITVLYGNYCYIFIENFPQKFSPCCIYFLWVFLCYMWTSIVVQTNYFNMTFGVLWPLFYNAWFSFISCCLYGAAVIVHPVSATRGISYLLDLTKYTALSLSMIIAFWCRWTRFTWQYPWFLWFGIFIINPFFIASQNSMQKLFLFALFKL